MGWRRAGHGILHKEYHPCPKNDDHYPNYTTQGRIDGSSLICQTVSDILGILCTIPSSNEDQVLKNPCQIPLSDALRGSAAPACHIRPQYDYLYLGDNAEVRTSVLIQGGGFARFYTYFAVKTN